MRIELPIDRLDQLDGDPDFEPEPIEDHGDASPIGARPPDLYIHRSIGTPDAYARLAPVIEEREIWACANRLIRQYGADAWFVAAQRADALLAEGKIEGHRTFLRILKRIRALEATTPPPLLH